MFEAKRTNKLRSTDLALYDNKLKLDMLQTFDPFEMTDLNGLKVLKNPHFEPYYKVLLSLKVADEHGKFLEQQTLTLQKDLIKKAKQETFLELLYLPEIPEEKQYISLLEEKLLLNFVNLVLEVEIPLDKTLDRHQINEAKKTFREMLQNA